MKHGTGAATRLFVVDSFSGSLGKILDILPDGLAIVKSVDADGTTRIRPASPKRDWYAATFFEDFDEAFDNSIAGDGVDRGEIARALLG